MPQVKLPDGSIRELPAGATAYDVALDISEGLARTAVATKIDGVICDLKTALPDVKRIVDPLQQMRIKLAKTKQQLTFPLETGRRARIIDLLKTISTRIPNQTDVEMTRVVIGQDNILISGNTDTFNTVDDIKTRLEKAEAFQKVVISSANLEKSGNRVNFKLKVQL